MWTANLHLHQIAGSLKWAKHFQFAYITPGVRKMFGYRSVIFLVRII